MRAWPIVMIAFVACAPAEPGEGEGEGEGSGAGDERRAIGESCSVNEDCASERCSAGICGANECTEIGAPCAEPGTVCMGGDCSAECLAPLEKGASCFESGDCEFDGTCASGSVCHLYGERLPTGGIRVLGECATDGVREIGERCDDAGDCAVACDGTTYRCRDTKIALGEACSDDGSCDSGLCGAEARVCVANECATPLEPCVAGGDVCAGGSCGRVCEPPHGRGEPCFERTDVGDTCIFDAACAEGLVCPVPEHFLAARESCAPPTERAEGEGCGDDPTACAAGLVCENTRCIAAP